VQSVKPYARGIRLAIEAGPTARGLKQGDSLAVNGCCLTVVDLRRRGRRVTLQFDLLQETWVRTNLQFVKPGAAVNLERPLPADGRLDGHFVTGHIDGVGHITRWERAGKDHVLEVSVPPQLHRFLVDKGSLALDGISLTVAKVTRHGCRLWIIPHTWTATALRERQVGDAVNLETDILGKYVERFMKMPGSGGR